MTQETGGSASAAEAVPAAFDRLIGGHRSAGRKYRRLGWMIAAAGLVVALGGFGLGSFALFAAGLVLALSALLAWKKAIEEAERADGLDVLRDEWRDFTPGPGADHLLALARRLYAA